MDLEDQPGFQALRFQAAVDVHHGQLDDVRGGALHRHVQRHPLPKGAHIEVGAFQLRQVTAAAIDGGDIALGLGGLHDLLHIVPDAVVFFQIGVYIGLGLVGVDADILGQGEGGDAVDNAEVDGLGPAAQDRRHLTDRDAEDIGGGDGVEILPAQEGLLHGFIPGDMGQQAQLDLAVVCVHQHHAGGGHKHIADLGAQLLAHGDVLQVWLGRGQAAGGSDGHLEACVDASVFADHLQKPIGIGGFQLGQHPVFQHLVHNGVLALELFQHVGIGAPAGFGLFSVGQQQLVKEH